MSRLYEALQRADLERKTASETEDIPAAEAAVYSGIEEPQPSPPEFALEEVVCHPWKPSTAYFPTLADRGEGVEQFRSLRSRIYQARYEAPLKTILVGSGIPSEGKTFIAANLAVNLARNTVNHILLIDGDLRRPTLHERLGAPMTPGLTEYLAGTAEIGEILQRDSTARTADSSVGSISNLTFIPAGKCGDNSSELVANHRIETLVATLAPHFDWIIIDSPPVLAVTDAVELSRAADAVLLIARGAHTPYTVAQRTQAAFSKSRILGFVLNDVKEIPRPGYNYYGAYTGSDSKTKDR